MPLLYSILYILCMSVAVFLLGRIFPRKWLFPDRFPYKSFVFERDGDIYNKLRIMSWKTKLPDMSIIITKVVPRFMPRKRLNNEKQIPVLIKETCIAESTHIIASVLGFGCVLIGDGIVGWLVASVFLLLNIPFVIMQRFNRPRLIKADRMLRRRSLRPEATEAERTKSGTAAS